MTFNWAALLVYLRFHDLTHGSFIIVFIYNEFKINLNRTSLVAKFSLIESPVTSYNWAHGTGYMYKHFSTA